MRIIPIALQGLLFARAGDGHAGTSAPINARVGAARVERSFVATKTAFGYTDHLVRFLLHLYDHEKSYLAEPHLSQMKLYDDNDSRNFEQNPTRGGNKRPELRSYIKRSIDRIEPARDGAPHNSPIKIDGEGALTYTIIRDYMEKKYNIVEVDRDAAINYLREIGKGDAITPEMEVGEDKVCLQIYQSNSQFSAIRSGIAYVLGCILLLLVTVTAGVRSSNYCSNYCYWVITARYSVTCSFLQ